MRTKFWVLSMVRVTVLKNWMNFLTSSGHIQQQTARKLILMS